MNVIYVCLQYNAIIVFFAVVNMCIRVIASLGLWIFKQCLINTRSASFI